ncbi:MAG: DUF4097 family beta strand repeat protein [Clostridia bacterium]|nr:DUF4097 family beta strand repeat protein [Clostridia bacterium]
MKEKLKEYIDSIFADAPDCRRIRELKEEMLGNISEKYDDLLREGKTEAEAYNASISSIGDVSDLIDSIKENRSNSTFDAGFEKTAEEPLSEEQSKQAEKYRTRAGIMTAVAIALYTLCWIPLIILGELVQSEKGGVVGLVIMLVMIAVATGLIIIKSALKPDFMKKDGEDDEDEKDEKKARKNPILIAINTVLWVLTFIVYFGVSFSTGAWHITWTLFLIAGAIDSVTESIFDLVENRKNRGGVITTLVIWAVVAAILIPIFAFGVGVSGERADWSLNLGGITVFSSNFYADGDSYRVGDVEFSEKIESFDISWLAGKVNIIVWDGNRVMIKEKGAGAEYENLMRSKVENGRLIIQYVESGLRLFKDYPEKELTVYLPYMLSESFGELRIESASSDIQIDGTKLDEYGFTEGKKISFGLIDLNTASGDVSLTRVDARSLTVDAAVGSVMIANNTCSYAEINAVSGKIDIDDCNIEELEIESVSGGIDIYMANMERGSIETVSGDVKLECYWSSPFVLEIDSVSGDVELIIPRDEGGFTADLESVSGKMTWNGGSGDRYTYGNGHAKYSFESVSGDVTITFDEN